MPLEYAEPGTAERIYDVEKAVGLNSPNQNGDVKLVQHMLICIYASGFATPPSKPLVMDGWIGPITVEWIKRFQQDVNAKGHLFARTAKWKDPSIKKCEVDGRVDAILNVSQVGQVSGKPYTISWMNAILRKLNPAAHANIPNVVPCKRTAYSNRPNPYNPEPFEMESGGF